MIHVPQPARESNASLLAPDFRALFESVPGAYLAVLPDDPVFTVIAVSDAYLRATLTKREAIVGRSLFEVFPDNSQNCAANGARNLRASLQQALATKAAHRMPVQRYDIRRHDGTFEERYWSPLNTPVVDTSGAVQSLIHMVEDVTEQVRAERRERTMAQDLHTSETRFRQLAETSTLGLVIGDLQGRLLYLNPTVRKLLGYTEQEVAAGRVRWDQLTPPEFASVDTEAVQQLITIGRCTPYEKAYVAKDGRRVPVLIGASLLASSNERTEVAAFVLDLTERKRMEQRDAFLVRLDDALRPLTDPNEMMHRAAQLLGEYLQADRCTYCHVAADEETLDILWNYCRPGVPSIQGRYQLTQFGAGVAQSLRADQPCMVEDIESDPSLTEVRAVYRQAGVRSHATMPLCKAGKLVAIMAVHQQSPRHWQPNETELVRLVTNRCWEFVERAHITRALRESEARYRSLFESIDEGFCIIEVLFDKQDQPVDYRFLETNPVFEQQSGMLMAGTCANWCRTLSRSGLTPTAKSLSRASRHALSTMLRQWAAGSMCMPFVSAHPKSAKWPFSSVTSPPIGAPKRSGNSCSSRFTLSGNAYSRCLRRPRSRLQCIEVVIS